MDLAMHHAAWLGGVMLQIEDARRNGFNDPSANARNRL
jgi:hypothetical protein